MKLLAGDVGATKTDLGLFEPGNREPLRFGSYVSADWPGLAPIVLDFLGDDRAAAACFGIAGPVAGNRVRPPNLDWEEDGDALAKALGIPGVVLVNDLHATAEGIPALPSDEIVTLQAGEPDAAAPVAIIAAGTGLGVSIVTNGVPVPSEGGHASFAPRNEAEADLREWLATGREHVEREDVVSGPGLVNIQRFLYPEDREIPLDPAEIAAIGGPAVEMFLGAYGSAAGDLALTCLPRAGLYVGGGIAPKMLARLRGGVFLEAFLAKGRSRGLLETIPVRVILNPETALLGAARLAARLAAR